ncbi:MAG: NAD(P)/FAD-dependent oxidoreductase [Candidatus Binatia bacterium]
METADIVIIGAGFAGASTAYHLARRGFRDVLVLEREAVAGMHASGRNAALAFQVLSDPVEAQLAVEGARFIAAPPEGFCPTPLIRRCGSLLVAGARGVTQLAEARRAGQRLGVDGELITRDEAMRRVPLLAGAPFGQAFWNPADGVVDIHSLLQGYLAGARAARARVAYRRAITGVRVSHGRVEAVDTDRERVATRCVVNAAGAWAGEIGVLAGVGARTLAPRRRHLFQTAVDVPVAHDWPFVWHNDLDVYFRPEGEGLLMSPCDATPHPPCEPVTDTAAEALLAEKVQRAFPALASARIMSAWACLRTFARDERFVIGRDPELAGLIWVAALGGHGMTTSAAVGRLGAAAVLGEPCANLQPFAPDRLIPHEAHVSPAERAR